ncbi:MAG: hypothetical protein QM775_06045 [Pirellulales bacterium]
MSETLGVDEIAAARSPDDAGFGRPFWFSYAANLAMMVSVSLLYVYADFIKSIGGTEWHVGWVVGVGMVGAIVMRFAQGVGIDHFGARRIWLLSNFGYIACCLLHLAVSTVESPWIYLLRIAYQSSLAGIFGASIAYVSGRAPIARMAEVIGTLGTSGFIGMMLGTAHRACDRRSRGGDSCSDRLAVSHCRRPRHALAVLYSCSDPRGTGTNPFTTRTAAVVALSPL